MPVIYDIETYPNVFLLCAVGCDTEIETTFEISDRCDDRDALLAWLQLLRQNQIEMVGFNNIGFDYPVIHQFMCDPIGSTAFTLWQKATAIIGDADRWAHVVWDNDRFIPQIDLFKIHHFDNAAKSTSLKSLQINMRSPSVEDLPFEPGVNLTPDDMDKLRDYCAHDVSETKRFYDHSRKAIAFRREIGERYDRDFLNHNDTKIGKDYFIKRLEEVRPGSCYTGRPRMPVQTVRDQIALRDIILPIVKFEHPEFARIHNWLYDQVIKDTKGIFRNVSTVIDGFQFNFGTGGIHGSVSRQDVRADAEHQIIDLDVTSYYPSIAITNRLYPEHLGGLFVDIYADVMAQRRRYPKGTHENAVLKLALNGVYGDSNNPYSPFYDPQYTMAITINGQLLLCMLAERLMMTVPHLEMIQINTDGLTVRVPRYAYTAFNDAVLWWQDYTNLELEESLYTRMWIRDVNNYWARGIDSRRIKRKGVYEIAAPGDRNPLGWHQDTSSLVVAKAVDAVLCGARDISSWIREHNDPFDFMCRAKAPRNSRLMHGDQQVQSTSRYYVAVNGASLVKQSPPPDGMPVGQFKRGVKIGIREYQQWHTEHGNVWSPDIHTKNKSTYQERSMQICAGWNTALCNRADDFRWDNVAFDWYISEAEKLLN